METREPSVDAFGGTTGRVLREAMSGLSEEAQRRILGLNAAALYALPEPTA